MCCKIAYSYLNHLICAKFKCEMMRTKTTGTTVSTHIMQQKVSNEMDTILFLTFAKLEMIKENKKHALNELNKL